MVKKLNISKHINNRLLEEQTIVIFEDINF